MTKTILGFLILTIFSLTCYSQKANQTDVLGWRDAHLGMTEKELIAAFQSEITKLPKRSNFSNWYADYGIIDYEISGRKYKVYFQMDKVTNKLTQILIQDPKLNANVSQEIYFNSLKSLLTRKYGTPSYTNDKREKGDISLERHWIYPTTTIALRYSWNEWGKFSLLTITYFPTNKELNKV